MKIYDINKDSHIEIDQYSWDCPYRPKTIAKLRIEEDGLLVHMKSYEKAIRHEMTQRNSPVHTDSCMEFFFNAEPNLSASYMNFEINPMGVMYIGYSKLGGRQDTSPIDAPDNSYFKMEAKIKEESWELTYQIPFEFIKKYFPSFDIKETKYILGNFYKCADLSPSPHYGTWNKVETKEPDFHQPRYFGKIILG